MRVKKIPNIVENGCCVGGHHETVQSVGGGGVTVTVTQELVLPCTKQLPGPHKPLADPQQPIPRGHEL